MKVTLVALQPLDGVYGLIPEGETFETAPSLAKELIELGLAKKQEKAAIQTKEEKNANTETK
jgi:hypothetical protein